MPGLDLEGAARDAEALLRKLDRLRQEAEAWERELRVAVERHAREAVGTMVREEQRDAAERLVARSVRIVDEVGAWMVGRSPWGLAQRLLPELRAGAEELHAFLASPAAAGQPPPKQRQAATASPPTPARTAP